MPVYLVERFLPAGLDVARAVAPFTGLTCNPHAGGPPVRLLLSVHVPGDETWFGWLEAPDAGSIADLARRAAFPLDRISRAVVLAADVCSPSSPVEDDR